MTLIHHYMIVPPLFHLLKNVRYHTGEIHPPRLTFMHQVKVDGRGLLIGFFFDYCIPQPPRDPPVLVALVWTPAETPKRPQHFWPALAYYVWRFQNYHGSFISPYLQCRHQLVWTERQEFLAELQPLYRLLARRASVGVI